MRSCFFVLIISGLGLLAGIVTKVRYESSVDTLVATPPTVDFIREFASPTTPAFSIDFNTLFQVKHWEELVDEPATLPQTIRYPASQIASLIKYADKCDQRDIPYALSPGLDKTLIWHRFQCGASDKLSPNFFSTPPFMHPSGISFVALALLSRNRVTLPNGLDITHLGYLHVAELARFPKLSGHFSPALRLLGNLDPASRREIKEETKFIFGGPNFVFIKGDGATYQVFPRRDWDVFAARRPIEVQSTHDFINFHPLNDDFGWRPNLGVIHRHKKTPSSIDGDLLSLGFGSSVFAIAFLVYENRRQKKRIQALVMQTLAHELRTPVASMQYTIDEFRKQFEALPPKLQDAFLSLCDDNQRLVELIKASTGLIKSDAGRGGLKLPRTVFPSANNILSALVEPFGPTVSFVPSPADFPLATDAYWLGVCLKNLIENARQYGKPPVVVRVSQTENHDIISVEDQGSRVPRFLSLRKGSRNGLGLGLIITKEFAELLGGKLRIRRKPHSIFSIQFPIRGTEAILETV